MERESADRALLAQLCDGDERALAEVYDRYAALVHGIARRVLGDDGEAEDVTQDVFTHLWRHPDRVNVERGSVRSYLGVVAHRRAVDALRRRARRDRREQRTDRERLDEPSIEETVVISLGTSTRARQVVDALDRLPEEQRVAIHLAYYGGRTYRDVAAQLGIPEGTAKSRLRLGLARLRGELESEGVDTWR